ncbi:hypothetical protein SAMN02745116_02303 [Pilibacter termitis]|uniref:Uncharacterized protein n=1 Tax=Pilibacter termitis TaxID=263852 RepID=A0A1T4QST3_9ENTE|nr:hypothetical protein [Pilibacter termitis]SKA06754.1 hypothetical protein SAMN02745116_02303 [Pilibacter termitis]
MLSEQTREEQLNELLRFSNEREFIKEKITNTPNQVVYIGEKELEGIGIFWKNEHHPTSVEICMVAKQETVDKESTYAKIFEQLSAKSHQTFGQSNFQLVAWQTSRDIIDFCTLLDFKGLYLTFDTTLDLLPFQQQKKKNLPKNERIYTLEELKGNTKLLAEFLCILEENYEESHLDNPLREMTQEEWICMIFSENPMTHVPAALVKDGHVASYAVCVEKNEIAEVHWLGCENQDTKSLHTLITTLSNELATLNKQKIAGHFRTTSKCEMYVLGAFPFLPVPSKVVMQKCEGKSEDKEF